jgi:hypothetical protein
MGFKFLFYFFCLSSLSESKSRVAAKRANVLCLLKMTWLCVVNMLAHSFSYSHDIFWFCFSYMGAIVLNSQYATC